MSGIRDSPSRRLYSLWAWRWTNCGVTASFALLFSAVGYAAASGRSRWRKRRG
jgi:hypothetical protein